MISKLIAYLGVLAISFLLTISLPIYGFGLTVQSWGACGLIWIGQLVTFGVLTALNNELKKERAK